MTRRSAPPPNRCVAKLCRNWCGWTGASIPASFARSRTICHRREGLSFEPRTVMKMWLEVFGFEGGPDPSGVARVTRFLDESLDAESFAPDRYYITMADADLV